MFRKIILLVTVVFFMGLVLFTGMMYLKNETVVYSQGDITLTVEKPTFFTLSDSSLTEQGKDVIRSHDLTLLGLPIGTYTLVERTLDNGVKIVFEQLDNTSWMPFAVSLNTNGLSEAEVKTWNPKPVNHQEDPVYGIDPTVNPYGTIKMVAGEILQGNLYVSRGLTLGNGTEVQELRHEIPDLTMEEGSLRKNFWLPPNYQTETWFMISEAPFFETAATEDKWIDFTLNNRLQQLNWLTPAGPMVKVEQTEDLRTQLAYSRDEERTKDPVSAEWNKTAPSLFFESMVLNSKAAQEQ
ncbi:hypothetical protein [Planococcus shenhongbingii]|uniref:Uncharacterized protein n=1 Tax=Planococcus shenhongbingii TaxID=3058398 RepID=A0ABT8N9D3_9BACL|nr:hypothetical protein [Planococcus sp. N017]MDN7244488.1 hypothetical protein [Planococcus sp. N017]